MIRADWEGADRIATVSLRVRLGAAGTEHDVAVGNGDRAVAVKSQSEACFGLFDSTPVLAYAEGTVLFKQGAVARDVYYLEQGLVKIIFLDPGGEEVIINLCGTCGTLIGDSCAILGRHYVSAAVVTRNTRLRRVASASFNELIKRDMETSWSLHVTHCELVESLLDRSAQLGYLSVRQRVEQLIWNLADACELMPTSKGERMQLPLKYRELAQLITVSPEHLCRVLGVIEKDGLIRREKGWLYLIERDRLFHRAQG